MCVCVCVWFSDFMTKRMHRICKREYHHHVTVFVHVGVCVLLFVFSNCSVKRSPVFA